MAVYFLLEFARYIGVPKALFVACTPPHRAAPYRRHQLVRQPAFARQR